MALVEIARFLDPVEAQVAAAGLRARGFDVFVQNEQACQVIWYVGYGLGGLRLWVSEADAEAAGLLLRADRRTAVERRPAGSAGLAVAAALLALLLGAWAGWGAVVLFGARGREPDAAELSAGSP